MAECGCKLNRADSGAWMNDSTACQYAELLADRDRWMNRANMVALDKLQLAQQNAALVAALEHVQQWLHKAEGFRETDMALAEFLRKALSTPQQGVSK